MKTSELKRILWEDCVESWSETGDVIYGVFWTVWKKERKLSVDGVIPLGVLKVLGGYNNTPLNEREDEKKYRIVFDKTISTMNDCLTLRVTKNTYYFSIFDNNDELFQRIFTQSEIDNLPAEIKGAIECGFLRKVEVE